MPARMREAMHAAEWRRAWLAVCLVLALSSGAMAQDGQITGPRREHIALVSRTQLEGLMDECRVLDDVGGPSVTLKKDRNAATV
jgi:hypothetical protein